MKRAMICSLMLSIFVCQANAQSAYCAKVGNDDNVKPIPEALVPEAVRLFKLSDESIEEVQESTTFRCMSGKVWLCNYGANLPCGGKANVSRISKGAIDYCKEFPGSDIVPMAATGHDTIYTWECVGKKPHIVSSTKVDSRGFEADIWKQLEQ